MSRARFSVELICSSLDLTSHCQIKSKLLQMKPALARPIKRALQQIAQQSPHPELHVRADQAVPSYRFVAEALAEAAKTCITRIDFVFEPGKSGIRTNQLATVKKSNIARQQRQHSVSDHWRLSPIPQAGITREEFEPGNNRRLRPRQGTHLRSGRWRPIAPLRFGFKPSG